MHNITIQEIHYSQAQQLQTLARQTFFETFSDVNTAEDMQKYLDESFGIEQLKAELENADSKFYAAKKGDEMIGYIKLNTGKAQTELKQANGMEIERIYVLQQYHGLKIGQLLYEKAVEVAKESGADYIWLGVWEENFKAIRFYEKNGFKAFDKHIFRLGNDEQTDIMMKLELKE
ncbi:MAG: GNAT family N-acetyltransferase [Agriterribacter sp.]